MIVALALFVAFVLVKSRISLRPRDPAVGEARRRIRDAKRRAKESAGDPRGRAAAWLDAARIALDELGRPRLAASYAVRAATIAPDEVRAFELMSEAFRAARRYRALERFLWRRLNGPPGAGYERAFELLVALYDGPMRRRERAQALRAMHPKA